MKNTKLLALPIAILFAVAAFAAELQKINVENPKDLPYTVHVRSGNETIAELKVIKPGTLKVEGGDVVWRMVPGGGKAINCSGGSKVDLIVEGTSVLSSPAAASRRSGRIERSSRGRHSSPPPVGLEVGNAGHG